MLKDDKVCRHCPFGSLYTRTLSKSSLTIIYRSLCGKKKKKSDLFYSSIGKANKMRINGLVCGNADFLPIADHYANAALYCAGLGNLWFLSVDLRFYQSISCMYVNVDCSIAVRLQG